MFVCALHAHPKISFHRGTNTQRINLKIFIHHRIKSALEESSDFLHNTYILCEKIIGSKWSSERRVLEILWKSRIVWAKYFNEDLWLLVFFIRVSLTIFVCKIVIHMMSMVTYFEQSSCFLWTDKSVSTKKLILLVWTRVGKNIGISTILLCFGLRMGKQKPTLHTFYCNHDICHIQTSCPATMLTPIFMHQHNTNNLPYDWAGMIHK